MPERIFRSPATGAELAVDLRDGARLPQWLSGWDEVTSGSKQNKQPAQPAQPSPVPASDDTSKGI